MPSSMNQKARDLEGNQMLADTQKPKHINRSQKPPN